MWPAPSRRYLFCLGVCCLWKGIGASAQTGCLLLSSRAAGKFGTGNVMHSMDDKMSKPWKKPGCTCHGREVVGEQKPPTGKKASGLRLGSQDVITGLPDIYFATLCGMLFSNTKSTNLSSTSLSFLFTSPLPYHLKSYYSVFSQLKITFGRLISLLQTDSFKSRYILDAGVWQVLPHFLWHLRWKHARAKDMYNWIWTLLRTLTGKSFLTFTWRFPLWPFLRASLDISYQYGVSYTDRKS